MLPNAKKIILGMLLAREGESVSAREAIAACEIFDITPNNARVSLARLASEDMVQASERGSYVLGSAAQDLAQHVTRWRDAAAQLKPWQGDYVLVHSGPLGRSDRKALRKRERALAMLGFAELDRNLYLRPNNLKGGLDGLRNRLVTLGLESEASMFVANDFDEHSRERIGKLWDGRALNRSYTQEREKLINWMVQADQLDRKTAARESYLLGGAAIRRLVYDPWLPAPLIDTDLRSQWIETVKRMDEFGKAIWQPLSADSSGMPVATTHLSAEALA